ncbi:MAG: YbaB/EbfC family nucleoid-associated protein [Candidatus Pacebacteria bacterium]|jgi:DNA-binding protein YbaB|nr:YbaB/EbfC family nucleoid-associated protein [Candidatus Paceibacterota bacterium]NMB47280.1 YbaB/EbfC family nucleoid-associated protein [Patescibacteria group bacterium]MDD2796531.1 YbaB/EbfC family nucleoid-associated protein [Candidatus Paceibacterota bacterium]MDD3047813.1 YbaB/EbfC family nucleoid-associated protein [Candidatus Paceibacterota bacterium]MDD3509701.1 YbaB/EbfC family nucleoid-associated protein [Candidatus Paceibacterota bacterium]
MFNKFKQIKQLKNLESSLKKQTITKEKDGIVVTLNLRMDILEIKLNPELETSEQEKKLKDCLNDAMNEAKLAMAKQAQSMGGFGL